MLKGFFIENGPFNAIVKKIKKNYTIKNLIVLINKLIESIN